MLLKLSTLPFPSGVLLPASSVAFFILQLCLCRFSNTAGFATLAVNSELFCLYYSWSTPDLLPSINNDYLSSYPALPFPLVFPLLVVSLALPVRYKRLTAEPSSQR